MFTVYLGFIGIILMFIAAILIIGAFISVLLKKPKIEWLLGIIIAISTIVSSIIYYYIRFILSGGSLSDSRVVKVIIIYIVTLLFGMTYIVHGRRRLTK